MTCSRVPAPSWRVAKQSLPVLRMYITRPAVRTTASVSCPASRCPQSRRRSPRLWVRSTHTGYAACPLAMSRSRLSRRTRSCSGRSSTSSLGPMGSVGTVWSVGTLVTGPGYRVPRCLPDAPRRSETGSRQRPFALGGCGCTLFLDRVLTIRRACAVGGRHTVSSLPTWARPGPTRRMSPLPNRRTVRR